MFNGLRPFDGVFFSEFSTDFLCFVSSGFESRLRIFHAPAFLFLVVKLNVEECPCLRVVSAFYGGCIPAHSRGLRYRCTQPMRSATVSGFVSTGPVLLHITRGVFCHFRRRRLAHVCRSGARSGSVRPVRLGRPPSWRRARSPRFAARCGPVSAELSLSSTVFPPSNDNHENSSGSVP